MGVQWLCWGFIPWCDQRIQERQNEWAPSGVIKRGVLEHLPLLYVSWGFRSHRWHRKVGQTLLPPDSTTPDNRDAPKQLARGFIVSCPSWKWGSLMTFIFWGDWTGTKNRSILVVYKSHYSTGGLPRQVSHAMEPSEAEKRNRHATMTAPRCRVRRCENQVPPIFFLHIPLDHLSIYE